MRRAFTALAALAVLAALLVACGSVPAFTDPARPVQVRAGERFAIRLAANYTTPFRWDLADPKPDPAVVTLVGSEYKPEAGASLRPGAGGTAVWTFRAVAPGQTRVVLREHRVGRDDRTAKTAEFEVVVR